MLEPANCPTGMVLALADALPTFGIKGPIGSQKRLAIGSRKVRHGVSKNEPYSTTLPRLRHAEFTSAGRLIRMRHTVEQGHQRRQNEEHYGAVRSTYTMQR